jgi:cruciform cutting endonuclease 1
VLDTTGSESEAFNPPAYAVHANRLAKSLLSEYGDIDKILIERQRWRSAGGKGVLEWTVRVNTFEAMLHAVLVCLCAEGRWSGTVESVSPQRVSAFWVSKAVLPQNNALGRRKKGATADENTSKTKRHSPRDIKIAKTGVVKDWLRAKDMVQLKTESVRETASVFADRDPGQSVGRKTVAKKLDDLADCLLQAMAWTEWEQNRENTSRGRMPTAAILRAPPLSLPQTIHVLV